MYNFYPRPPRGGRPEPGFCRPASEIFLSTPSARRATLTNAGPDAAYAFLSTPSARRATQQIQRTSSGCLISIHALREEGDPEAFAASVCADAFLSTPSARRATVHHQTAAHVDDISIHALREEGDVKVPALVVPTF